MNGQFKTFHLNLISISFARIAKSNPTYKTSGYNRAINALLVYTSGYPTRRTIRMYTTPTEVLLELNKNLLGSKPDMGYAHKLLLKLKELSNEQNS